MKNAINIYLPTPMQVISTVFHVFGGGSPTFSTNWGGELKLWHKRMQQMTEPWRWRILGRQKKKLHNFVNEAGISEGNKSLTTSRMVDLRCKVGRVSLRRAMKSMGVKASNLKRESKHKLPLPTVMSSMLSANAKGQTSCFRGPLVMTTTRSFSRMSYFITKNE